MQNRPSSFWTATAKIETDEQRKYSAAYATHTAHSALQRAVSTSTKYTNDGRYSENCLKTNTSKRKAKHTSIEQKILAKHKRKTKINYDADAVLHLCI